MTEAFINTELARTLKKEMRLMILDWVRRQKAGGKLLAVDNEKVKYLPCLDYGKRRIY